MTIAVDLGRKTTKQAKRRTSKGYCGYRVINGFSLVGLISLYSAKRVSLVKR